MNDSPFAAPRDLSAPDSTPESGAGVQDAVLTHDAVPTHDTVEFAYGDPAQPTEPAQPALHESIQPDPFRPHHAGAAESAGASTVPGRVARSTIALIAVGSLVVGGAAGFGGAWAYNQVNGSANPAGASASGTSTLPDGGTTTVAKPEANTVAAVAAAAMPSVVSIENLEGGQVVSEGSGFVIREDGYILTNNHVVAGSSGGSVNVVMGDGSEYTGTVVGGTADYDLAVVKIDAQGLTPLVLGDSDALVVGHDVIAVGSPLGLDATVTTGIVSALHRPVTAGDTSSTAFIDAIQTDAAINPGNSGGPLLNAAGQVIGINSAIASLSGSSSSQAGSVGLGFAIPSNQARRTAEELIATGEATYPVIGVILDSSYTGEGVKVADDARGQAAIVTGGPADLAGIKPGDIITAIDGRVVTRSDELVVAIRAKAPGDTITLTVSRGTGTQDLDVTLTANTDVNYGDSGTDAGSEPGSGSGSGSGSGDDSGDSLPKPTE